MSLTIPVIDVFAGPGGLSEGFASFQNHNNNCFKICLSIEKDPIAYMTLQLRSFFRQFEHQVPDAYYDYLHGELKKEELFKQYPVATRASLQETWLAELSNETEIHNKVEENINNALAGSQKWVLIGGPPCQAYSLVGRSRMKKTKPEEFEKDKRHFLYREYLNIIAKHGPPVFVMENVPGMLSSKVNGDNIFEKILHDLRNPTEAILELNNVTTKPEEKYTYRIYSLAKLTNDTQSLKPADYIIKAEDYGIPQARHRVILLGIRSDLDIVPSCLPVALKRVPMIDAISDLPALRSSLSKEKDCYETWKSIIESIPQCVWFKDSSINKEVKEKLLTTARNNTPMLETGGGFLQGQRKPVFAPDWFYDDKLGGINHHQSRGHIREDLYRYFFASCFAQVYKRSPEMRDFPQDLLPKHANIRKAINGEMFCDRFRVQLEGKPSTTITSHISKDGHYYIHPDPKQCRSLTVREAARLQTFPDNYFFEGPKTEQYRQIGNAVPPFLAKQIAKVVYQIFYPDKPQIR